VQYAPVDAWAPFLRELPGSIICAQYDATTGEVAALSSACGRDITVPQGIDQKRELDRTCALISACDVMVSAPTAVSWLSAGAGLPTAKVLYNTSWASFGKDFEPFAPAARCIMPATRGDWTEVFARATDFVSSLPV
jgi:hypothetical protein